ncbi:DUF4231 domain-containing protein [Turneriella parva]|uniref:Anthranilate synthase component I n=1 Tax=Turneriella parva (strain ATCC BAA-1111 / DSM 21527 / NCTC 11395 / H) TaxID=869212 RepID=I4B4D6_TURPD|nr:DUF4231 domain-containing protein [Turneriella parva]AFM12143.1 anthranilate synthase component I [Turneriella parva DSM 21527]
MALEYPSLYSSADKLSNRTQALYKRIFKWHTVCLVAFCIIFSMFKEIPVGKIISAILILISFVLNIFLTFDDKNTVWYTARALAESVKTMTWRFVMRAEPFDNNNAQVLFTRHLGDLLKQNQNVSQQMLTELDQHAVISESMKTLRSATLAHRKSFYLNNRIKEQLNWYSEKARLNRRGSKFWYGLFFLNHLILIVCFFFYLIIPSLHTLIIDTAPTIAGAILSWLQIQRYRDLTSAYNLTANEITLIRGAIYDVKTQEQFSLFVSDAESAFSREHTQWAARKDN